MAVRAAWFGRCGFCTRDYRKGTRVAPLGTAWAHAACAAEARRRARIAAGVTFAAQAVSTYRRGGPGSLGASRR